MGFGVSSPSFWLTIFQRPIYAHHTGLFSKLTSSLICLVLKIKSIKVEGNPPRNYKWSERHHTLPRLWASFVCPNMSMKQPIAEEYVVLQQPARAARRLFSTLFFFQPLLFPIQLKGPAPLRNAVLPSLLRATSPQTGQVVKYVLWTESPKSTQDRGVGQLFTSRLMQRKLDCMRSRGENSVWSWL